jgi:hypothetical protein
MNLNFGCVSLLDVSVKFDKNFRGKVMFDNVCHGMYVQKLINYKGNGNRGSSLFLTRPGSVI